MRSFRKVAICSGLVLFALVALWLAGSFAAAYTLTRRPRPWQAEELPAVAGGPLESTRLTTSDGEDSAPGSRRETGRRARSRSQTRK